MAWIITSRSLSKGIDLGKNWRLKMLYFKIESESIKKGERVDFLSPEVIWIDGLKFSNVIAYAN